MKKGNIVITHGNSDAAKDGELNAPVQFRKQHDNYLIEMAAEQFADLLFEYCQFKKNEHNRKSKKKDLFL
jgi:hypothetical protein